MIVEVICIGAQGLNSSPKFVHLAALMDFVSFISYYRTVIKIDEMMWIYGCIVGLTHSLNISYV